MGLASGRVLRLLICNDTSFAGWLSSVVIRVFGFRRFGYAYRMIAFDMCIV